MSDRTRPGTETQTSEPRTYQLFITLGRRREIQVGRLGRFVFPAGDYVYTGSAKRNIEARIRRHLSQHKKLRWHIDYLLNDPHSRIERVALHETDECTVNQATAGTPVAPGFGASDCSRGCGAHLKFVGPCPPED